MSKREKTGGRQAGTPNKRTTALMDRLEALDCDPIEGMVEIAKKAMASGDFGLAGNMYKELAQYCYPKRKALEIKDDRHEPISKIEIVYVDPKYDENGNVIPHKKTY